MKSMTNQFQSEPKILELANELKEKQKHFVPYIIDSTPGSMCRRGNSISEANHSSIYNFFGKKSFGDLENVFVRLMDRHKHICLKTNKELHNAYKKSRTNFLSGETRSEFGFMQSFKCSILHIFYYVL